MKREQDQVRLMRDRAWQARNPAIIRKKAPESPSVFQEPVRGRSTVIGAITGRPTAAMRTSFLIRRERDLTDSPM